VLIRQRVCRFFSLLEMWSCGVSSPVFMQVVTGRFPCKQLARGLEKVRSFDPISTSFRRDGGWWPGVPGDSRYVFSLAGPSCLTGLNIWVQLRHSPNFFFSLSGEPLPCSHRQLNLSPASPRPACCPSLPKTPPPPVHRHPGHPSKLHTLLF
jgi:hypothetical protein